MTEVPLIEYPSIVVPLGVILKDVGCNVSVSSPVIVDEFSSVSTFDCFRILRKSFKKDQILYFY